MSVQNVSHNYTGTCCLYIIANQVLVGNPTLLKFYPLHLNHRCSTFYCTRTLPINITITFWPTAYKNSFVHKITYSPHCVSEVSRQYFKLLHRSLQFQICHWYNTYCKPTSYAKLQEHTWKIQVLKVTAHFLTVLIGWCAWACVYEPNKTKSLTNSTQNNTIYTDTTLTSFKCCRQYPWPQLANTIHAGQYFFRN